MAMYGSPVPWWRVVRADGSLPESHQREAFAHYREEATPLRGTITDAATLKVDLRRLWQPDPVTEVPTPGCGPPRPPRVRRREMVR